MSYIIAIDVGIKNLGLCVFDFCTNTVVLWENVCLVPNGRYLPALNVRYVRDFVQKYRKWFDHAFMVLVERQMRCNMKVIEAVLQTMFFETCIVLSARAVKAHYNLCTNNYKTNKAAAVGWARTFMASNPQVFSPSVAEQFSAAKKLDDFADSLLLVMYYLDTYSNQLT